jgi:cytoskeletal protein CcmA (bactofilin family)
MFTITATYYDSGGIPIACSGNPSAVPAGSIPSSVLIHSVGQPSGLTYPKRAMDAYATLTLNQGSSFTASGTIFANGNLTFQANAQVGGSQYSDADIYVTGNFDVAANSTIYGNVYAQGTVTLQANSEVQKSVWANGNITLKGNSRIRGNATASPASSTITLNAQSTIYGNAKAGSSISGGTVKGTKTIGASSAPPTRPYPVFTYNSADWTTNGYTVHTYANNCTQPNTDLSTWFGAAAGTAHVIRITGGCAFNIASATIKGNLAIINDGNVSMASNSNLVASGGPWNLYIFAGYAGAAGCKYDDGNNSSIGANLNTLIWTPSTCSVTFNNNSSITQGQVISGNITFKHTMAMQHATVIVPSSGSGGFKEDVAYIREVVAS